jgi:hypothetical protein
MKLTATFSRSARVLLCSLGTLAMAVTASAAIMGPQAHADAAATLVHSMLGTWDVKEWMWQAPGGTAVALPTAVAQRQLVGNDFIQEVMSATPGSQGAFTRIAYFGYNAVNQSYEYFSLDTRAPQMMNERSFGASGGASGGSSIDLLGSTFVAPQWGKFTNAAFRYRLVVGPVQHDRQEVVLYLTPLSGAGQPEFEAFKYLYTRRH